MFILGFLASVGAGGSSRIGNLNFSIDDTQDDIGIYLQEFLNLYLPVIVALICIGVFIAIGLWLLRLTSQASLISAASKLDNGEKVSIGDPFAQRATVLDDCGVTDSIRQGWATVRQNAANVFILVLIFLLLGIVYTGVVFAVSLPIAALAFIPVIISIVVESSFGFSDFVLLACGGLTIAIIMAMLNAVLVAFRSAVITLA